MRRLLGSEIGAFGVILVTLASLVGIWRLYAAADCDTRLAHDVAAAALVGVVALVPAAFVFVQSRAWQTAARVVAATLVAIVMGVLGSYVWLIAAIGDCLA